MSARAADVVLHGGKIITVNTGFAIAEAVAIAGNRIAYVGADAGALAMADSRTQVIDLKGRAVMPGLIDGHAHMDREGLKQVFPSLANARSVAEVKAMVAELARRTPKGEWIVTMPLGDPPYYFDVPECYAEKRLPTRRDLDEAAPDHPVYIRPIWGFWRHTTPLVSVANSRALALAGITKNTVAPSDTVVIDKDAKGEPTGIFYDNTIMSVVEMTLMRAATGFSLEDRTRTLPAAMRAYHAFGTTSIFEEHGVAGELLRAYKIVRESGAQTMRATLVISPKWNAAAVEKFEPVVEAWASWLAGRGFGDDWLRVSGVFVDIGPSREDELRAGTWPYTGWAGFNFATGLARERAKELCLACAKHKIRVVAIWPNMLEVFDEVNRVDRYHRAALGTGPHQRADPGANRQGARARPGRDFAYQSLRLQGGPPAEAEAGAGARERDRAAQIVDRSWRAGCARHRQRAELDVLSGLAKHLSQEPLHRRGGGAGAGADARAGVARGDHQRRLRDVGRGQQGIDRSGQAG